MDLADFLVANQNWIAPIIEWGGMILFLAIVLSPFLIIRHSFFKPTRWWHIVGAYMSSFVIFSASWYLLTVIDQWLIKNYFNTIELASAYQSAIGTSFTWLLVAYPLFGFYSARLLRGPFTRKRFFFTSIIATVFALVIWAAALYIVVVLSGWALSENL